MSEKKRNTEKLTLEDLLRLKRAEQPDEMFWSRFDRELEKKIVRSVVSREPRAYAGLRWVKAHAGLSAGIACSVLVLGFLLAGVDRPTEVQPSLQKAEAVVPKAEISKTANAVPTRPRIHAPTLSDSQNDFVIEVLSSGGGVSSGANLTFSGKDAESGGAYYVADQLSSADQGWSGERLPF